MTNQAASKRARQLGQQLYELVASLEPAQWDDEANHDGLRAEFAQARERVEEALAEWRGRDEGKTRRAFRRVAETIGEHLPDAEAGRERWMAFREQIHPAYEGLAEVLSSAHVELPSLRPTNYARSAFHVLSALVALMFVEYVPWDWVTMVAAGMAGTAWTLEITRRMHAGWNDLLMKFFAHVSHPHERYKVNSATWFMTALVLLALLGQPIACVAALLALGLGDPAAALVGRKFGSVELVNNRTLEGSATFAVVSALGILAALGVWHGEMSTSWMLLVSGLGGLTGALVELFSRRVDDNFAIPIVTGLVVWLVL